MFSSKRLGEWTWLAAGVAALCGTACGERVTVDIPAVAGSTTSAQARFDWSLGKGTGRWNGQVVVRPSSTSPRLACIYEGRCDSLPQEVQCRFVPVDAFAEHSGSDYCWFGGPPEMKGTHAIAIREGEDCEGAIVACKDM